MLPPDPAPPSCDSETSPSSTPNEPSETPKSVDPVVSEWLRLASMDRQSPNFVPLLSSLVEEINHPSTVKLQGNGAEVTLSALVEVCRSFTEEREPPDNERCHAIRQMLRESKIPIEYERDARSVMRTLAYNSGQVPLRYRVQHGALSMEGNVIARGGSAEVREGRLGDKVVAVKILRTHKDDALRVCHILLPLQDVLTGPTH